MTSDSELVLLAALADYGSSISGACDILDIEC